MRLSGFQNGKMGLYSSKIDRDTAKNVKIQILKNDSFCLKIVFFLTKLLFSNFYVLQGAPFKFTGSMYYEPVNLNGAPCMKNLL